MSAPAGLDELLDQLRARGERVTTARRAVLAELLRSDGQHLTAESLVERVNRQQPDVHLSTVYRTLEFLEQSGLIAPVHLDGGPVAYHFVDEVHHHAVCDDCGLTIELPDQLLAPVASRLRREHGFVARPNHLTINGRCAACEAKARA